MASPLLSNLPQSCAVWAGITFHLIKQFVPSKWFTRFSPEVFKKKTKTPKTLLCWLLHGVVHSLKQAQSLPPIFTRWVSQSVKQSLHSFLEAVKPEWCEAACENVIACLLVRNISVWFTLSLCPEIPPFNSWMRLWRVWVSAPSDHFCLSLHFQSHSSHLSGLYGVPPASAIAHQNPVRLWCCRGDPSKPLMSCFLSVPANYSQSWGL